MKKPQVPRIIPRQVPVPKKVRTLEARVRTLEVQVARMKVEIEELRNRPMHDVPFGPCELDE